MNQSRWFRSSIGRRSDQIHKSGMQFMIHDCDQQQSGMLGSICAAAAALATPESGPPVSQSVMLVLTCVSAAAGVR